mmetsp:Transcript_73507/g.195466  ORF Transcript_73507/g.195466 Transcript_73507/m.195466 type:complete len:100 (+) Transcript_73507:91-390(+)
MPIRHVVILKCKEEATAESKSKAVAAINGLTEKIPEIKSMKCGVDAGLADGNHDIAITADFESTEAYTVYAKHPEHVAVITDLIKPMLQTRTAVQFETP